MLDPNLFLNRNGTAGSLCLCFAYHRMDGFWGELGDSTYLITLYESTWLSYGGIKKIDSSFITDNILNRNDIDSTNYILKKETENWYLYDEHYAKVIAIYEPMLK